MTKQMWVPIFGNAEISDGMITHLPVPALTALDDMPSADSAPVQPPHAIVRSNLEFEQGTITWEAKLGEQSGRVQLLLAADPGAASAPDSSKGDSNIPELSVGLNVMGALYGFAIWNGAWEGVGGSGHGSALPVGQWIHLKLTVRGSIAELYVDGVKVAMTTSTLKRGQIGGSFAR